VPLIYTLQRGGFGEIDRKISREEYTLDWSQSKVFLVVLGSLAKQSIPCLTIQSDVIERVTTFKLLGITLSSDLSWEAPINAICAKVAPRLYYLKQLRRAGLPSADLLYFYLTLIKIPVLCLY